MDSIRQWLRTESRLHIVVLCLIILVGIGTRLYYATITPILGDESETYFNYVDQPLAVTVSLYDQPNNHILNSLLAHLSIALFGDTLWSLRLPTFIAGILAVPLTYVLARCFYDRDSGLLAAGLVATSPFLIHQSINARGYPFATALLLIQFILVHHLLLSWRRTLLGATAIVVALQLYAMPSSLYAVGIPFIWLGVALLIRHRTLLNRAFLELFLTGVGGIVLTILLYLPVFLRSGISTVLSTIDLYSDEPFPVSQIPINYYRVAVKFFNLGIRDIYPVPIIILLSVGILISLALYFRSARERLPMLIAAALWIAPILAIQRINPYGRVWAFLVPIALIAAAAGLVYLLTRWKPAIQVMPIVSLAITLSLMTWVLTVHRPYLSMAYGWGYPEVRRAVVDIQPHLQSGDVIGDIGLITLNPLRYHFKEAELDTPFLIADSDVPFEVEDHPERVFIVIPVEDNTVPSLEAFVEDTPEAHFQHQSSVLELLKASPAVYSDITLIGTYDNFAVYLLEE